MTVSDLISILQQYDPAAIVVLHDHQAEGKDAIVKFGVGEVQRVFVTGEEDLGLIWLRLANKDSPDAVPGLLIGEKCYDSR